MDTLTCPNYRVAVLPNIIFFRFCWIVFYLLGMTTLLPWNFFISVNDYWNYKVNLILKSQVNQGGRVQWAVYYTSP